MALRDRRSVVIGLFLAVTLVFTRGIPERIGDTLQVTLPLAGFGCAVATGNISGYFTRYATMWATVHTAKRSLGGTKLNQRPRGGGKGFPSGHTASAVFGASSLVHACLSNAPVLKTIVVVGAAYTGSSRIEAGKHNIWQVLAGALLALAFERGFRRGGFWYARARGLRRRSLPFRKSFVRRALSHLREVRDRIVLDRPGTVGSLVAAIFIANTIAGAVRAETWALSAYTGYQSAGSSDISGVDPTGIGAFMFSTDWNGSSFEMPPYWGLRGTYWLNSRDGIALELTHAKVIADPAIAAANGFSELEFTDGLNTLTLNWMRRLASTGAWTPYSGLGGGIAFPYVEVTTTGDSTNEYQVTGPAVTGIIGAARPIGSQMDLFLEYKGTWTSHEADLVGGGRFEADILTHALNIGVTLNF